MAKMVEKVCLQKDLDSGDHHRVDAEVCKQLDHELFTLYIRWRLNQGVKYQNLARVEEPKTKQIRLIQKTKGNTKVYKRKEMG